jgi:hypothetical protein
MAALKQRDTNTNGLQNSASTGSLMKSDTSQGAGGVKRLIIKNNLFLDIDSLSKNLQTILTSYQMIVIARVKSVTKHMTDDQQNPFGLEDKETFFLC